MLLSVDDECEIEYLSLEEVHHYIYSYIAQEDNQIFKLNQLRGRTIYKMLYYKKSKDDGT